MADVIATLYPFDDSRFEVVKNLMQDAQNKPRLVTGAAKLPDPDRGRCSRETTIEPESEAETDQFGKMDSLRLRFGDSSYKNGQGIMFGWLEAKCDIVLPKQTGISREHCYLTFDDKNRLVLVDRSYRGTIVEYDGKGGQLKKNFTWILGGDGFTELAKVITIQITTSVKFQVVVPKHNVHSYTYIENIATFSARMKELRENLQMDYLAIHSEATTLPAASGDDTQIPNIAQNISSETRTPFPTIKSIVVTRKHLGKGSFGSVDYVWDASTGLEYARKYFPGSNTLDWEAEAERMKSLKHANIVQLKAILLEGPSPGLYLEFVPLGSLDFQFNKTPPSLSDLEQTLLQGLSALEYLHGQPQPIVHRDIKPENILVMSRDPLHIKLADFGLSKASDSLYTFCGTARYVAPEIVALQRRSRSSRRSYTAAVDIWSLGVVILQYGHNLPTYPSTAHGTLAMDWPKTLVRSLHTWKRRGFDVLYHMLVLDPQQRHSASTCLQQIQRERSLRSSWMDSSGLTATNSMPLTDTFPYALDEEATQVFDNAARARGRTTLAPYDRISSRQQWAGPTESVSVHDPKLGACFEPNPSATSGRSTADRAQHPEAEGSSGNPSARDCVKKRAKLSISTTSMAGPSGRRPRRHRSKSVSKPTYYDNSTRPDSALALFEKHWLDDPNWVGSSVAAMGQSSASNWSGWTGDGHATGIDGHQNAEDRPNDGSSKDPGMTTPDVEYLMYYLNNASYNTGQ